MSPETKRLNTGTIMGDALILKPTLIAVQEKMHDQALKVMENELERAGFDQPENFDTSELIDTRIKDKKVRIAPEVINRAISLTHESAKTVLQSRINVEQILQGEDSRIIIIVGPCSIHDPEAALEYAEKVKKWREIYGDDLEIIMRMYPSKPRTELKKDPLDSWEGLDKDPLIDGSNDINLGMIVTRLLAREITTKGVPVAVERLDPTTPQYIDGLVTYDAIGARTTTSQNARHYASGTSSVVGFKNTTEGSIDAAVEAVASANVENTFSGTSPEGLPMEVWTSGNDTAHVILRGYEEKKTYMPNYAPNYIATTKEKLRTKGLPEAIIVDASHANSAKKAVNQIEVVKNICEQIILGETAIKGVMIESNLVAGKQNLKQVREARLELEYGKSITDECIGLNDTEKILKSLAVAVKARRNISVMA